MPNQQRQSTKGAFTVIVQFLYSVVVVSILGTQYEKVTQLYDLRFTFYCRYSTDKVISCSGLVASANTMVHWCIRTAWLFAVSQEMLSSQNAVQLIRY